MRITAAAVLAFLAIHDANAFVSFQPRRRQRHWNVPPQQQQQRKRRNVLQYPPYELYMAAAAAGDDNNSESSNNNTPPKLSKKEAQARQQQLAQDIQQATVNSQQLKAKILLAGQETARLDARAQEASLELSEIEQQAAAAAAAQSSNSVFAVTTTTSLAALGGIVAARQALSKREAKLADELQELQTRTQQQEQKLQAQKQQSNVLLVRMNVKRVENYLSFFENDMCRKCHKMQVRHDSQTSFLFLPLC